MDGGIDIDSKQFYNWEMYFDNQWEMGLNLSQSPELWVFP